MLLLTSALCKAHSKSALPHVGLKCRLTFCEVIDICSGLHMSKLSYTDTCRPLCITLVQTAVTCVSVLFLSGMLPTNKCQST